jgi:hypothetical protein
MRYFIVLVLLVVLSTGCGSDEPSSVGQPTPTGATATGTTNSGPTLVGRWERVNECPELVKALDEAGLGAIAPSVVGDYFPEASSKQLAAKNDVCMGAEPFVHSHFFSEAGTFGSLDENKQQVDDGSYEAVDSQTFRISSGPSGGSVEFRYEIDNDTLTLSPVITKRMLKQALANPLEFSDAGWSVSVAYPGQTWRRVDCAGWC